MASDSIIIIMAGMIFGSNGLWAVLTVLINRRHNKQDKKEEGFKKIEDKISNLEKVMSEKFDDYEDAMVVVLHDRLYQGCKYFIHKNEISTNELKNLDYIHTKYAKHGGNGTGTLLFERVKQLKIVDDESWLGKL